MEQSKKNNLKAEYKLRKKIGGVYKIRNKDSKKYLVESTQDLQGIINRFNFSQQTNLCVYSKLKSDWIKYGAQSFELQVLEELEMKDNETQKEFIDKLSVLKELWQENLANDDGCSY